MELLSKTFMYSDSLYFWGYLLALILITLSVLILVRKQSFSHAIRSIFSYHAWLGKSARADLGVWLLVVLFAFFVFYPYLDMYVLLQPLAIDALHGAEPIFSAQDSLGVKLLITVITFIFVDFLAFLSHFLRHKIRILWNFHAVHHSSEILNIYTVSKVHPFDYAFKYSILGAGLLFLHTVSYFIIGRVEPVVFWGSNAVTVIFLFTIHLHHWHIPITYPKPLRLVLMSPHLHQLHHSNKVEHYDCNLGTFLSIWDRMFGTYKEYEVGKLKLSLGIPNDRFHHSVVRMLYIPIWDTFINFVEFFRFKVLLR